MANNKYMENHDLSQKSVYIPYLDANNLYGWAMSQPLPTHKFRWVKDTTGWRDYACVAEVDTEYPEELHDLHNEYPLAPKRILVNKTKKLIPNLRDKKNCVAHSRALKQYERMGLNITKVHRVLRFEESPWLAK